MYLPNNYVMPSCNWMVIVWGRGLVKLIVLSELEVKSIGLLMNQFLFHCDFKLMIVLVSPPVSKDNVERCSWGLVLLLNWIPDGSVIVVTSSLRKVEANLLKAETRSLLKISFTLLGRKTSHYCYTTLHAVMEIWLGAYTRRHAVSVWERGNEKSPPRGSEGEFKWRQVSWHYKRRVWDCGDAGLSDLPHWGRGVKTTQRCRTAAPPSSCSNKGTYRTNRHGSIKLTG